MRQAKMFFNSASVCTSRLSSPLGLLLLMAAVFIPIPIFGKVIHLYQPLLIFIFIDLIFRQRSHFNINSYFGLFSVAAFSFLIIAIVQLFFNHASVFSALGMLIVIFQAGVLSYTCCVLQQDRLDASVNWPLLFCRVYFALVCFNFLLQLSQIAFGGDVFNHILYSGTMLRVNNVDLTFGTVMDQMGRYCGVFALPAFCGVFTGVFLLQYVYYMTRQSHFNVENFLVLQVTIISGLITASKVFYLFTVTSLLTTLVIRKFSKLTSCIVVSMFVAVIFFSLVTSAAGIKNFGGVYLKLDYWKHHGIINTITGGRFAVNSSNERLASSSSVGKKIVVPVAHSSAPSHQGTIAKTNFEANSGVLSKIYHDHLAHSWLFGVGPGITQIYDSEYILILLVGGWFSLFLFSMLWIYAISKYLMGRWQNRFIGLVLLVYAFVQLGIPVYFGNQIQVFIFESLLFYFFMQKNTRAPLN